MKFRVKDYKKETLLYILVCIYFICSGVVFFEPSPPDIIFILILLYSILKAKYTIIDITIIIGLSLTVMIPFTFALNKYSMYNIKFTMIDIYLLTSIVVFSTVFYSIFKNHGTSDKAINDIMYLWCILGCINVTISLIGYITGNHTILGNNVIWGNIRMQGLFKDANVFGPYLIVPAVYLIEKCILYKKNNLKDIVLLIILNTGILWSFSRGAWISYIVALVIIFIKYLFTRTKKILSIIAIICVCMGIFFIIKPTIEKTEVYEYFESRLGIQSYDEDRFNNQEKSVDMLSESPIFGVGPGNYESITNYSTHSSYARTISEKGIFGAISMLIILGIPVYLGFKIDKIFLLASLISVYVGAIAVDTLHWRHLYIVIALIISCYKYKKNYNLFGR